ncbi:MAG TPA: FAD-binding protein, partial [Thermoanaerobaculia bacterium]
MTVHTPRSTTEVLADLKAVLGDRILLEEEARAPFRSDFGRLVDRLPGAVARCRSAAEVAEVVRFCRERSLPIAPRGQAHTQSGQATSAGG